MLAALFSDELALRVSSTWTTGGAPKDAISNAMASGSTAFAPGNMPPTKRWRTGNATARISILVGAEREPRLVEHIAQRDIWQGGFREQQLGPETAGFVKPILECEIGQARSARSWISSMKNMAWRRSRVTHSRRASSTIAARAAASITPAACARSRHFPKRSVARAPPASRPPATAFAAHPGRDDPAADPEPGCERAQRQLGKPSGCHEVNSAWSTIASTETPRGLTDRFTPAARRTYRISSRWSLLLSSTC